MSDYISKAIVPVIIALLIIWLIYRIRNRIRLIVKEEIYNNLPSIKETIDDFEYRINYLKSEVEALERKIKELENKIKI
jgi:polyhydroxyalkanoate synthesis regulator phasin